MSEETEKRVVITFSAKNLVKETANEIQINMRGIAYQFQAAAYSVGELNKLFFNNSTVGKEVAASLHAVGIAMRGLTIIESFAKTVGVLTGLLKAQEVAEWNLVGAITKKTLALGASIAAHVLHAAHVAASTLAEWAHTGALQAKAIALSIANALMGPYGWAILAGAAATAAIGIGLASRIPSHHYTGVIPETGPYLMAKGQFVGAPSGGGGLTLNVDARGSTFASDYDVDKMMNRVVDRLKRAGVVER